MNKKIKIIELLNKIANGEEVPSKIKCKEKEFYFNKYEKSIDYLYRVDKDGNGWLVVQDIELNDEIEILEDNTEEIKEVNLAYVVCQSDFEDGEIGKILNKFFRENDNKINELVKRINYIERKINDN